MKDKILIVEQGEYSDYEMYFVRVPKNTEISEKDLMFLLGLDGWSQPTLSGYILGEVVDHKIRDLIPEAEKQVNQMFCCYDNRKYKTILDKEHTKEELLEIAMSNDNSGLGYWEKEIDLKYPKYLKALNLLNKLSPL